MATPAGFTALFANRIQDATGVLCVAGTLNILPTDGNDQPIGTTAGGVGGPIASAFAAPVSIVNGILAANATVADTSITLNQHISYRFVFRNPDGSAFLVWKGVQPSGATFNLDTYQPNVATQSVITAGPQGPVGATGPAGQNGIASVPALARLFGSQLPNGANLFRSASKTANKLVDSATGSLFGYAGGIATDYVPANAGNVMSMSQALGSYSQNAPSQPGSSTANLYDYTQQSGPTNGQLLDATTGGFLGGTFNSYGTSGFQYVYGLAQVTTGAPLIFGFQGKTGIAFYDANKAFISGITSGAAGLSDYTNPYGPITVPAGAYWMKTAIAFFNSDGTNLMTVAGTTLPGNYIAYAGYPVTTQVNGIAFFDQNLAYISGIAGANQVFQNFSVPGSAAYLRAGFTTDVSAMLMVTNGPASPSTYADGGYLSPSQTSALVAAALASSNSGSSMTALWPAMRGLSCWLAFEDGSGSTVADVSGSGKNGSITGDASIPSTWAGPVGLLPNSQNVTVANQNGRPTNGIVAYFPAASSAGQSGYVYMGGDAVGSMNSWRLRTSYGVGTDHGNYAMFPALGYSNGGNSTQALQGISGVHAVEVVIGDGGSIPDRIYIDGQEVQYSLQNSAGGAFLGGAQLTNSLQLRGTASAGIPAAIYGFWSADTRDTPAQAKARTLSELQRVAALGVMVGIQPNSAAPDSVLAITGTSIDVGFQASQTPASLLALNFPCTIFNFAVSGQACKDMVAGFQDREATVIHPTAQRNIAYHGGVTNGVMNQQESPQNALLDVLAWNRKAKALGYKTIATTMLSRSGNGYNNQTGDVLAQAFNALLLSMGDEFDWIANLAADPQLGATGASTSTTYFADGVHPNNTGQARLVTIMKAAVQGVYGVPQTPVSGNYTAIDSDRVIIQTSTSASTITLKSALNQSFNSAGRLTITNIGTGTLTVAASASQTVNGAGTISVAPGATVRLIPYVASAAAGGANWITV